MKSYKKKFAYNQKYEWDKIALKYMRQCNTILDVGCGKGRFISHNPKKITGVDHNKRSLEACKKRNYSVKYAKVTKLPFKDNSFDAVHCSHVIEHLFPEDAHKLLREMDRVLKVGGIFCLRTPLLHERFYYSLTHIKPYYPKAVMHYLKIKEKNTQRTLDEFGSFYEIIKLKYRRDKLFSFLGKNPPGLLGILSNILYRINITSPKKTGYMLILKKIK